VLPRIGAPDAGLVAQLARLRDEESRLRKAIAEDGEVQRRPIQNAKGETIGTDARLHPGLAMLRRIGKEAVEAASELGLSPAGRRRLGLETPPEPREPDALDRIRETRELRRHRAINGEL
jgi:phage terminase small subunit